MGTMTTDADEQFTTDQPDDTNVVRDIRGYAKDQKRRANEAAAETTKLQAELGVYRAEKRVATLTQVLTASNLPAGLIDLAPADLDPNDAAAVQGFVERAARAIGVAVPAPASPDSPPAAQSVTQQYQGFVSAAQSAQAAIQTTSEQAQMQALMDAKSETDVMRLIGR